MRTTLFCALFVLAAPLSAAQIALPVTFEDGDATFYELNDFEGNTSQIVADPTDADNMVVESVRGIGAGVPAGTTVADVSGFTTALPFAEGATTMSVRVWTPEAGTPVRLKVEEVGVPTVSVETQVVSTKSGEWETLVFDFANEVPLTAAINFASTYNKATIFFNFGQEGATEATTYYWDDVAFGGEASAGIELPVTFEADINYELRDFEGTTTTIVADPTDASNTVAQTIRGAGAATFAGTVIADINGFDAPIPFAEGATTMSLRVWSPTADTPVRLKVEKVGGGPTSETEVRTTVAMAWETLVFDFSTPAPNQPAVDLANTYDKAVVFFNFDFADSPAAETYYWDDLAFGGEATGGATPIADVRAASTGTEVTIAGVVTRAMGAFSYVQDDTGAITIRQTSGDYFDDVADGTIVPGTQVTITGTTSEFRGLFQINEDDLASYTVDGTTAVPAAQMVTVADLTANGEAYEAELVEVTGLTTAETGTFAAGTSYTVNDGSGDATLRTPNADDSMIDGTDIPGGPFTFTGVVGQFTFADPATDGYQLLAIALGDVEAIRVPVVSLPVRFEDDIDYELNDFGGNTSQLVADPTDASNTVVESVRGVDAAFFAGTTVGEITGFTAPIPFAQAVGATTMNVRVWTPVAGTPVRFKVEQVGVPEVSVEAEVMSTKSGEWEVLVFDFVADKVPDTADINFASTYTKASIFFNFNETGATEATTYYWDDVAFGADAPVSEEGGTVQEDLRLTQNAPNPFSDETVIRFTLPTQDHVQVVVYNHLGQRVETLIDGPMGAGVHSVLFDASGLASGTYFYRINHGRESVTRSMVLAR